MATERILLYDGDCGFCQRGVQFVLDRDPEGSFQFAPLQGETTAALRERLEGIPEAVSTMVLIERDEAGERLWLRSQAVFRTAAALPLPWRLAGVLRVLPRFLTDPVYWLIAQVRLFLPGSDACRIPTEEERARFLP